MKLFCTSDIHGFYDELIEALNNVGFDPNNPEHMLIVCGDVWDRGAQPFEVMQYLEGLERCVLIKGNHESLFEELVERGYPGSHDFSNGTYDTVCTLGNYDCGNSFDECCCVAWAKAKPFLDKMINYFETENYIFVHSFIPLNNDDGLPMYYIHNRKFSKMENWREAHHSDWEAARWGNPFDLAEKGFLPDKTLVFGHWGTYDQRPKDYEGEDLFNPIYGDGYIGIDATTALSGQVNVVVLEDCLLTN